jgi:TonB family protein
MMNPNQPQAQYGGSFPQPQQRKGCWGRNWKWIVPTGCLGLILGLVALVAGIFFIAMSAVKSSEVYQGALSRAQKHPVAIERLGQPIKDGWFVKGNVKIEGGTGYANFEIPVSGTKNSGRLFVVATSEGGSSWIYETLDLAVEGGERVSLLEPRPTSSTPGAVEESDEAVGGEADEVETEPPPPPPPTGAETDSPSASTDATTVSGGVLNGKAVSKPQPAYPPIAKAARASGTVTVQVLINESGVVVSAKAVSGHPLLQQAAVQAAREARFAPTLLNGKPVKVSGVLTYNFALE